MYLSSLRIQCIQLVCSKPYIAASLENNVEKVSHTCLRLSIVFETFTVSVGSTVSSSIVDIIEKVPHVVIVLTFGQMPFIK